MVRVLDFGGITIMVVKHLVVGFQTYSETHLNPIKMWQTMVSWWEITSVGTNYCNLTIRGGKQWIGRINRGAEWSRIKTWCGGFICMMEKQV